MAMVDLVRELKREAFKTFSEELKKRKDALKLRLVIQKKLVDKRGSLN